MQRPYNFGIAGTPEKVDLAQAIGQSRATMADTLNKPLCLQDMILRLHAFWGEQGCLILQPYDMRMGAGTYHPATTLRALGPEPWNAAYVQPSRRPKDGRYGVDNVYDLAFNNHGVSYGDVFLENEKQMSKWNFEVADTESLFEGFRRAEAECQLSLSNDVPIAAYEQAIEASHLFNLLQARGVISVQERASYMGRVRDLARGSCEAYMAKFEDQWTAQYPEWSK